MRWCNNLQGTEGDRYEAGRHRRDLYECGAIQFTGRDDALFERHLLFDNVIDPGAIGLRERYEAIARSVRDILSQRWLAARVFGKLAAAPDPWEVARPQEQVAISLGCSFEIRSGTLAAVAGQPSMLLGLPYGRPVVGYGGRTINTLRLWRVAAPDSFDLEVLSADDVDRRAAGSPNRNARASAGELG